MELMSTCLEKLLHYTREPVPERILGKIATCVRFILSTLLYSALLLHSSRLRPAQCALLMLVLVLVHKTETCAVRSALLRFCSASALGALRRSPFRALAFPVPALPPRFSSLSLLRALPFARLLCAARALHSISYERARACASRAHVAIAFCSARSRSLHSSRSRSHSLCCLLRRSRVPPVELDALAIAIAPRLSRRRRRRRHCLLLRSGRAFSLLLLLVLLLHLVLILILDSRRRVRRSRAQSPINLARVLR